MRDALAVPWDIVISDYTLPRFSGPDALQVVQDAGVDVPVIIVSRTIDEEVGVACLLMGATDYVMKRNVARLAPAVERALREAEDRRRRQEAERALRASEERYRELIENANDVIFTADLQGNFTSLNAAGERISGYTRDQVRRMNMVQVLTPESYEKAQTMREQKLTDKQPTRYEVEMIARDGHLIPLEISTRLIYHDGRPVGIQGIARDVTERRRAEEELRSREHKQAAIARLSQQALATGDIDHLFEVLVESVVETLGVECSSIFQVIAPGDRLFARAGKGWRPGLIGQAVIDAGPASQAGYALHSNAPVVVDNLSTEARFTVLPVLLEHGLVSGISVIIHGRHRPFGVLSAFSCEHRRFSGADVHFMQAVANLLGTAIERRRLEEEREQHGKELATHVLLAQEEERKRIARELHDETAQTLAALLAQLDLLERHESGAPDFLAGFDRARDLARRALEETRALAHDLRPMILDDVGLVAALEWLLAEHEKVYGTVVDFDLESDPPPAMTAETELALFRIAQEALTNSGKHAGAKTVCIGLSFPGGHARLMVEDDGRGFDRSRAARPTQEGRLGLYGMQERAALLGGGVTIASEPDKGTTITAEIPLAVHHSASARSVPLPARVG
jgi:PAS domain S-box-containing protein